MKVPFVCGPDDLRLREVAEPHAGRRDVVLRIGSVGICGSDLGFIAMGGTGAPGGEPFPLGHELSGVVIDAGAEVTTVATGDRVILNPLVNMIGNGAAEGGFAERLLVRDVAGRPGSLLRLPDSISFDQGALVEPLAVAVHAVARLGAAAGDTVAIFGAGPIGLAALMVLRHRGIGDVVMFDPSPFRRERAERLGARATFDPGETDPAAALATHHGTASFYGRAVPATTHYLEASGAAVIPQIVGIAAPGATLCVVSLQKKPVELAFGLVLAKELTITGAVGYPTELSEAIALLDERAIDPEAMVSHRFAAGDVLDAFATARQPDRSAKVLVRYDA